MFQNAVHLSKFENSAEQLPEGYDTLLRPDLNSDAVDMSIGQWQRCAIARTFYKNSRMIIMDEPSASLDPVTEEEIYQAVFQNPKLDTKLMISHRLSYVKNVQDILVLENGTLIEHGSFEDLLKNEGTFHYLYSIQAERYHDEVQGAVS